MTNTWFTRDYPWFPLENHGLRGKTGIFPTHDQPVINPWFTHDYPWFSSRKIMGLVGPSMNTSGTLFWYFFDGLVRQMRYGIKTRDGKFDSCATSIESSINSMWVWFSHSTDCKSVANLTKNRRIYALLWWRLLYTVFADLLVNRTSHVGISRTVEHWLHLETHDFPKPRVSPENTGFSHEP